MAINLVVAVELTCEAVQRNCGVGSLPINIIEALTFEGMIIWTGVEFCSLYLRGNSKYKFPS
jgi:hypothetical protein